MKKSERLINALIEQIGLKVKVLEENQGSNNNEEINQANAAIKLIKTQTVIAKILK